MISLPDTIVDDADGAPWLGARRAVAAARLAQVDPPDDSAEVWRYSPVRRLDLGRFGVVEARRGEPEQLDPGEAAARIELRNGQITGIGLRAGTAGLEVLAGRDHDAAAVTLPDGDEFVALLAETVAGDPVHVRVAPGAVIDGPIVIDHQIDRPELLTATVTAVTVGADAEVTIVERRRSHDDDGVVVPLLDIEVGDAARVQHIDAQLLGAQLWQLGQQRARVGAQATLAMHQAALGGDYARMRVDCQLVGRGATGNLSAVSFGSGQQTLDFRTFQDHVGADTTSDLLFKGVVDDAARSIYSGLIRVRPDARGTSAFQTNRNIKLADTAWAESVPNLEIENNDVRCSHASTVGPIDPDQRFYLESRGVPPAEADQLILAGFFDEVLARFPVKAVAAEVGDLLARRLDRVSTS
ncbi:MAG: SufD family Fe-S cluster assembly protein [Acidimicrobiia bacterium]|nr:SufD family Fe-S cluster assembly protein [Acidimicrobiia bacterium]